MARPQQPGLTENELEVMNVLWNESPLKVGEILERLNRRSKPAYTSLLTLVKAMERKGYIGHVKNGKAFNYYPWLRQQSFLSSEITRMAKRLFNGSPLSLAMNLVKDEHLSDDEIATLKKILEAR